MVDTELRSSSTDLLSVLLSSTWDAMSAVAVYTWVRWKSASARNETRKVTMGPPLEAVLSHSLVSGGAWRENLAHAIHAA